MLKVLNFRKAKARDARAADPVRADNESGHEARGGGTVPLPDTQRPADAQSTRRRCVVVSAFPKSASQHYIGLISDSTARALPIWRLKLAQGYGHTFIDARKIPKTPASGVVYGHLPAAGCNLRVLAEHFDTPRAVVLVRSLPDVVVSVADHIRRVGRSPLDYDVPGLVDALPGGDSAGDALLYDRIISFTLPWYLRFICSWVYGDHGLAMAFSTFEEHTAHPRESVRALAAWAGLPSVHWRLPETEPPRRNFNQGSNGRGGASLSDRQLWEIERLVGLVGRLSASPLGRYLLHGYQGLGLEPAELLRTRLERGEAANPLLQAGPEYAPERESERPIKAASGEPIAP